MDFSYEKFISNFVQSQFPAFYREEGENFTLFMKAYYEWMEQSGNPVHESRSLLDYRDIDNTVEDFLEYFQKKYLYGIPFNIISNKRFLLKHILDVYRSKGTIQCYRLLFKLIYDEDVKIYLPSTDMLKVSDGTWKQPRYLEVSAASKTKEFFGKIIIGTTSGTKAVVENYVRESYHNDIVDILYISNIQPTGAEFIIGEKVVLETDLGDFDALAKSPNIVGSLARIDIINGGQGFQVGDLLKIVYKDPFNSEIKSYGVDGIVKVTSLARGEGQLSIEIQNPGFGYLANSKTFLYKDPLDVTGQGASFRLQAIGNIQEYQYNTDLICDYMYLSINAVSYGFPKNTSANLSSNIGVAFAYTNAQFGSVASLDDIRTGNGYQYPAKLFVRSSTDSGFLTGNVSYDTTSYTVTGVNTEFSKHLVNNDIVVIQANSSLVSTKEYIVIREVVSDTELTLYGLPTINSTASARYKVSPVIMPSQFALYEPNMYRTDGTINGKNEIVSGEPSFGNTLVGTTKVVNSGKGYVDGEFVEAYRYGSLNTPSIIDGGSGYSNGDLMIFSGGSESSVSPAKGYITTYANGTISNTTLTYTGSGYTNIPKITVKSKNGTGALLTTTVKEYNTFSLVSGRVKKKSIGDGKGFWTTTRGFLNSDKHIQDSYYYQDYSYEVRIPLTLQTYKNILYNTFHPSGSEMFGKYALEVTKDSPIQVLYDNDYVFTIQITDELVSLTSDTTTTYSDNDFYNVDATDSSTVYANTDGVSNTSEIIKINNTSNTYGLNDLIYYQVPSGGTAIGGLTANSYYFISFANSSYIALSKSQNGANINLTESRTNDPGQSHSIFVVTKQLYNIASTPIKANTLMVNSSLNVVAINNSKNYFENNDYVYYQVPTGGTAINNLVGNTYYYISFSNSTHIAFSETYGGSNVDLVESRTDSPAETHFVFLYTKHL